MHRTINDGGFEQVEEALYKLEPCTDHLALFVRPCGRHISKKQLSHYSVVTPQSPLALPHPLSRVCICISVMLNSRPCALLPPPLFSLSSLSLLSLLLVCHVRVHIRIRGPLIPSPPSLSPRMSCLHLHSWWRALLPPLPCSLAPLLAYTTASLSPAPCLHSRLAPLRSPHRASFAFTTPLVIVFTFMTGPLPFVFTTVPVFVCHTGPRRPHLCLCRGLLVRYMIGTPAGMPSLMALLSSLLLPAGPQHLISSISSTERGEVFYGPTDWLGSRDPMTPVRYTRGSLDWTG